MTNNSPSESEKNLPDICQTCKNKNVVDWDYPCNDCFDREHYEED